MVRVARGDGAALVAERSRGNLLQLRIDRDLERVPGVLPSEQLVDEVGRGRRLTPGEVCVVGRLEPRASAEHGVRVVAGDVPEEILLGVHAPPRVALVAGRLRFGQHRSVGREDLAAFDVQLSGEQPWVARVRRVLVRARDLDDLEVDEQRQEDDGDRQRHLSYRRVHVTASPSEIRISRAMRMKFAKILEPPYETNGSVIPVSGSSRETPPMISSACTVMITVRPVASSVPNVSRDRSAMWKPRAAISPKSSRIAIVPMNPISSPIAAKMKSVGSVPLRRPGSISCGWPSPRPVPVRPPDPSANADCAI